MSCTSKFIERFDIDLSPELIASNSNINSSIYASPNLTISDLSLNNQQHSSNSNNKSEDSHTYLSSSPTSIKHDDNFTIKIKHFLSHTISRKKNKRNRYSTHSSSSTNSTSSCSNTTITNVIEPHSI